MFNDHDATTACLMRHRHHQMHLKLDAAMAELLWRRAQLSRREGDPAPASEVELFRCYVSAQAEALGYQRHKSKRA